MPKLSGPMVAPRSGNPPKQAIVLLHGYGADGRDLIDIARNYAPLFPDMMFLAPDAPTRAVHSGFGFQWFPLDPARISEIASAIPLAAPVIREFLDDLWEQTGLTPRDTFLGGFSQGAMMALHVGTSVPEPLGGIVAFSGAFVPPSGFFSPDAPKPPVALIHGALDDLLPADLSRAAHELLAGAGFDVSLHISPNTGHGIASDGLQFAAEFLQKRVT